MLLPPYETPTYTGSFCFGLLVYEASSEVDATSMMIISTNVRMPALFTCFCALLLDGAFFDAFLCSILILSEY